MLLHTGCEPADLDGPRGREASSTADEISPAPTIS
jgi:hypothetical protein